MAISKDTNFPRPSPDTLEWIRTEFNLPSDVAALCSQYFLRIWDGNYVRESVQDGVLYGRSGDWIVHWQSTPAVVRSAKKVACSFREYQGKKYVVIKVWVQEVHSNQLQGE